MKMNKTVKKILIGLFLAPWAVTLILSIYSIFGGFTFFFSTCYGLEAFWDTWVIYVFLFWYAYIPGALVILVMGLTRLFKRVSYLIRRKNADKMG